jgi:hypothetical protein
MTNTDYVVREWRTQGGNLITVSAVDMGGRLHNVTMFRAVERSGGADDLVRHVIGAQRNIRRNREE